MHYTINSCPVLTTKTSCFRFIWRTYLESHQFESKCGMPVKPRPEEKDRKENVSKEEMTEAIESVVTSWNMNRDNGALKKDKAKFYDNVGLDKLPKMKRFFSDMDDVISIEAIEPEKTKTELSKMNKRPSILQDSNKNAKKAKLDKSHVMNWLKKEETVSKMIKIMKGEIRSKRLELYFQKKMRDDHLSSLSMMSNAGFLEDQTLTKEVDIYLKEEVIDPNIHIAHPDLQRIISRCSTAKINFQYLVLYPEMMVNMLMEEGYNRDDSEKIFLEH